MTNTIEPAVQDVSVTYLIGSKGSTFTVRATAGGLLSSFGHNPVIAIPDFSGRIELSGDIERSNFELTISAPSLRVTNDMSNKDRQEIERVMHQDVLESARYPQIRYECSRVSSSQSAEGQFLVGLNGELTLHGVTDTLPVSARVTLAGETLKAFGNFSILQSDYGIELVSVAGGALKVKDELKVSFDILARKQQQNPAADGVK